MGGFKTVPGTVLMVAGTWLVLEDLSLVQFELYRGGGGNPPSPLTPETPTQSVRGLPRSPRCPVKCKNTFIATPPKDLKAHSEWAGQENADLGSE